MISYIHKPPNLMDTNMASEKELYEAVKENLERSGKLNEMKAKMRAEIINVIEPPTYLRKPLPELPRGTLVINELIREYLEWHGYKYSASILITESGIPTEPLSRSALSRNLGVMDNEKTSRMPLLYSLVSAFKGMDGC